MAGQNEEQALGLFGFDPANPFGRLSEPIQHPQHQLVPQQPVHQPQLVPQQPAHQPGHPTVHQQFLSQPQQQVVQIPPQQFPPQQFPHPIQPSFVQTPALLVFSSPSGVNHPRPSSTHSSVAPYFAQQQKNVNDNKLHKYDPLKDKYVQTLKSFKEVHANDIKDKQCPRCDFAKVFRDFFENKCLETLLDKEFSCVCRFRRVRPPGGCHLQRVPLMDIKLPKFTLIVETATGQKTRTLFEFTSTSKAFKRQCRPSKDQSAWTGIPTDKMCFFQSQTTQVALTSQELCFYEKYKFIKPKVEFSHERIVDPDYKSMELEIITKKDTPLKISILLGAQERILFPPSGPKLEDSPGKFSPRSSRRIGHEGQKNPKKMRASDQSSPPPPPPPSIDIPYPNPASLQQIQSTLELLMNQRFQEMESNITTKFEQGLKALSSKIETIEKRVKKLEDSDENTTISETHPEQIVQPEEERMYDALIPAQQIESEHDAHQPDHDFISQRSNVDSIHGNGSKNDHDLDEFKVGKQQNTSLSSDEETRDSSPKSTSSSSSDDGISSRFSGMNLEHDQQTDDDDLPNLERVSPVRKERGAGKRNAVARNARRYQDERKSESHPHSDRAQRGKRIKDLDPDKQVIAALEAENGTTVLKLRAFLQSKGIKREKTELNRTLYQLERSSFVHKDQPDSRSKPYWYLGPRD